MGNKKKDVKKHCRRRGSEKVMKGGFSHFNLSLNGQVPLLGLSDNLASRGWCRRLSLGGGVGEVKRLKCCLLSYLTGSLVSLTGSSYEVNEESRLLTGRLFF